VRDPADADAPGCAGDIFDNNGLAERLTHVFGQNTCPYVDRTARGERRDDSNWVGRIGLRARDAKLVQSSSFEVPTQK
jgi:hypothetical protein